MAQKDPQHADKPAEGADADNKDKAKDLGYEQQVSKRDSRRSGGRRRSKGKKYR
jgi:hypothetical protein